MKPPRKVMEAVSASPPYFLRDRGWITEEQATRGARAAIALRQAIRDMEQAGGARWVAAVLGEELARLHAATRGRKPRAKGTTSPNTAEILLLALRWPGESANVIGASLHAHAPRRYGASAAAIAKTITRLRADVKQRGLGVVFAEHFLRGLELEAGPAVAAAARADPDALRAMLRALSADPPRGRDK